MTTNCPTFIPILLALAVAANAAALTELKTIADEQLSAFAGGTDHLPAGPARPDQPRGQSPEDCPDTD